MKRYWKIIFFCILSIVVIGTFYIQSSLAEQENIQIEFEKVKGSEKDVKDLLLYGNYVVGNLYQDLQITEKETTQMNYQSLFQRLSTDRYAPIFRNLINNHKSFMRGKDLSPNCFYEDENLLIYANVNGDFNEDPSNDINFTIEVFNKDSEETFAFQTNVAKKEKYSWMNLEDVQAAGGSLNVITKGYGKNGAEDLLVYTFDLKEQKLTEKNTIISSQTTNNGWNEISMNHDYNSIQPENYHLIIKKTFEAEEVRTNGEVMSYDGQAKLEANEAYLYDIKNNQLKKLSFPDELLQSYGTYSIFHSTIYIQTLSANGIGVHPYDIEKDKWGEVLTFDLPQSKNTNDQPFIKLMNEKIYTIHSINNGHILSIGDLITGKSLYEGKLLVTNQKENQEDYQVDFHEMELLKK